MNALTTEQQIKILHLLLEGNSLSATSRITNSHLDTCNRLMVRFGTACQRFLDRELQDLEFRHIQIDEIWTFCRKKQYRITGKEPDLGRIGSFYVFVALDEDSRLVPAHRVGHRDEKTTQRFVSDLASRLKWPRRWPEGEFYITRISSDGFKGYPAAIEKSFGSAVKYGQIIKKEAKKEKKKKIKSAVEISKKVLSGNIDDDDVTTSLVERHNLTIRTFMKRFTRRTIGYSKKLENLIAATSMYVCHYNYCWKVKTLGCTPAKEAGISGKDWTLEELYEQVRACSPELIWGR